MIWLTLFLKFLAASAISKPIDCVGPGLESAHTLHKSMASLHDQLGGGLAFDHITEKSDSYSFNNYGLGFSYYVPEENSRFERLEGYDDVYIWVNHYDPKIHTLNRLFLGSNAILKIDRSTTPPKVIYLSREIHVQNKSATEIMDLKNVNESLCTLNLACSKKLVEFNASARTSQFDSKVISEYKTSLTKLISDQFVIDTYADIPAIRDQALTLLEKMKTNTFKNIAEMNEFLLQGLKKIRDEKLAGLTREQYLQKFKGEEKSRVLEYITYDSISDNAAFLIGKYAHRAKKDAILEYCSKSVSQDCALARSLKSDLDSFQTRRKPLPAGEQLPRT